MTTKGQRIMLFGLWKRIVAQAGWSTAEAGGQRDELTILTLKIDPLREAIPSWNDLSNRQVSALKAEMEARLGALPLVATAAGVESPEDAAERAQLAVGLLKDAVAAYGDEARAGTAIASICADVHGESHPSAKGRWQGLPLAHLKRLRIRLAHIARAKNAKSDGYIDESRL